MKAEWKEHQNGDNAYWALELVVAEKPYVEVLTLATVHRWPKGVFAAYLANFAGNEVRQPYETLEEAMVVAHGAALLCYRHAVTALEAMEHPQPKKRRAK